MSSSTRQWILSLVLAFPAVAITTVAEKALSLGPDATFALLMVMGVTAALIADRIVNGPVMDRPRRDQPDR